jgi:hypothetical protein
VVKNYIVGFDVSMKYIKGDKIQRYFNDLVRRLPTGIDAAGDYVRINKDELIYGTNNVYAAVRRKASVYPASIGGSAEDGLSTSIHVGGNGDGVNGTITVDTSSSKPVFIWQEASAKPPVIASPIDGASNVPLNSSISGTSVPLAQIRVNDGAGDIAETTANAQGFWTAVPATEFASASKIKIAAFAAVGTMTSLPSDTVEFVTAGT